MSIRIICDSTSDLTKDMAQAWGVMVLPVKIIFDGQEYLDGVTMNHEEFYQKLSETKELPTTSQIAPFEYEEAFKEVVEAGDTAICITVSSKLSGCYQSAHIAAEEYKDHIHIVDSENVCIGEQLLVKMAVDLRDAGKSAEEIVTILNEEKKKIRLIALLDTLEYLKKGGRISQAAALAGTLLSIKPVITIKDGEVVMFGKARGSKNGTNMLIRYIEEEGGIRAGSSAALAYSGQSDECLKKYMQDSAQLYEGKVAELPISTIGCTIGTHVGPGAIAAAFIAN